MAYGLSKGEIERICALVKKMAKITNLILSKGVFAYKNPRLTIGKIVMHWQVALS